MKRQFYRYIPFLFLITVLVFSCSGLFANNPGSMLVNGIGLSADYCYADDKTNDTAVYLSYRNGFIWMVSAFLTADAGYRFDDGTMNFKAGVSGMILFWGLEAGVAGVYDRKIPEGENDGKGDGKFAPGMYIGANMVVPGMEFPVFLSAGKSFYAKNHEHEYYGMVTCLVNFSD